MWLYLAIALWSLFGFAAAVIAEHRGSDAIGGFILGFLFGPFGLIFAYYMGDETMRENKLIEQGLKKRCPTCMEVAYREAKICPHCRHDFTALQLRASDRAA